MLSNLAIKNRRSLFVFECIGSFLVVVFSRLLITLLSIRSGLKTTLPFFFANWMVTMLTIKISGAFFNPALSFVSMMKPGNDGNFPKSLGLVYIGAQFIGAFFGGLLALFLTDSGGILNGGSTTSKNTFSLIVYELLGSFLLGIVFLILNEQDHEDDDDEVTGESHKSKDPIMISLFWSIAYTFCVTLANNSLLNPAAGFSILMTMLMNGQGFNFMSLIIYVLLPFCGVILSLMFY